MLARKMVVPAVQKNTFFSGRIRAYTLEGLDESGQWKPLVEGISVGQKRIDVFPEAAVKKLRLRITQKVGTPIIRELAAFYAVGVKPLQEKTSAQVAKPCGSWPDGATAAKLDLTPHISIPATYLVTLAPAGKVQVQSAKLKFNGNEMPAEDVQVNDNKITIRQTQQVMSGAKTELDLTFAPEAQAGTAQVRMVSE